MQRSLPPGIRRQSRTHNSYLRTYLNLLANKEIRIGVSFLVTLAKNTA